MSHLSRVARENLAETDAVCSHRLLKKVTGGSKVIIFDHTIRRGEKKGEETPDTPQSRKPVQIGEAWPDSDGFDRFR